MQKSWNAASKANGRKEKREQEKEGGGTSVLTAEGWGGDWSGLVWGLEWTAIGPCVCALVVHPLLPIHAPRVCSGEYIGTESEHQASAYPRRRETQSVSQTDRQTAGRQCDAQAQAVLWEEQGRGGDFHRTGGHSWGETVFYSTQREGAFSPTDGQRACTLFPIEGGELYTAVGDRAEQGRVQTQASSPAVSTHSTLLYSTLLFSALACYRLRNVLEANHS